VKRLYGGHRIESLSDQSPDGNKWVARVTVSWDQRGTIRSQPLAPRDTFDSIAEAEAWGIRFGKRWIDQER
jgi:hypothetical protein